MKKGMERQSETNSETIEHIGMRLIPCFDGHSIPKLQTTVMEDKIDSSAFDSIPLIN